MLTVALNIIDAKQTLLDQVSSTSRAKYSSMKNTIIP